MPLRLQTIVDSLQRNEIDIWRRLSPALGYSFVISKDSVRFRKIGEQRLKVCGFQLEVDSV